MSQDSVMNFFESVRSDDAVVEQLRAVGENIDEFARLSVELSRERGFAFEASDVRKTLDELARQKAGELSNEDLSAVAGGTAMCTEGFFRTGGGGGGSAGCQPAGTPRIVFGYVQVKNVVTVSCYVEP